MAPAFLVDTIFSEVGKAFLIDTHLYSWMVISAACMKPQVKSRVSFTRNGKEWGETSTYPVNTSKPERFSIPFFFGANYDVVMETLPSCITETRPRKYKSITAGEHYLKKMGYSYGTKAA